MKKRSVVVGVVVACLVGVMPAVAQAQLEANTAQAMRDQLALAGPGRGAGGSASAFRDASANAAQIQAAAADAVRAYGATHGYANLLQNAVIGPQLARG